MAYRVEGVKNIATIAQGSGLYYGQIFTWFINSLINVSPQGQPRLN